MNKDPFAAGITVVAAPAEPPDSDTIADRKPVDAVAEFGYRPGDFMPRSKWPRHVRETTADEFAVGAAYPACGDRYAHLATARWQRFDVGQLQRAACGPDPDSPVLWHWLQP